MTRAASPDIYPQYCFHLSPTINKWCPLQCSQIQALLIHAGFEGQNLFFYGNHPIKWVRVAGVVVAIDEYLGRLVVTVDDSSGANVECVINLIDSASSKVDNHSSHTRANPSSAAGSRGSPAALPELAADHAIPERAASDVAAPGLKVFRLPDNVCDVDVGFVVDVKGGLKHFREQKQITVEKLVRLRSTEEEVRLWEKAHQFSDSVLSKPWVLSDKQVRRSRQQAEGLNTSTQHKARKRPVQDDANALPTSRSEPKSTVPVRKVEKQARVTGLERKTRASRPDEQLGGEIRYDALGF